MTGWAGFAGEAPELARTVRGRLTHQKHCVLATLRADGSPRLSGIEIRFWQDDAWLGMMPGSEKGADLDRDGRFELHSAPSDIALHQPDARIRGRAVRIADTTLVDRFAATLPDPAPTAADIALYRVELSGAVTIGVEGDTLVIQSWRPRTPVRRRIRR